MECPYCLGRELLSNAEDYSNNRVTEFMMSFDYPPTIKWAHRLIHKKYGFTIEMHDCVDLGGWKFQLAGPWPTTKSAIAKLNAFIKYARRSHETRGRPAGKKDAKPRPKRASD